MAQCSVVPYVMYTFVSFSGACQYRSQAARVHTCSQLLSIVAYGSELQAPAITGTIKYVLSGCNASFQVIAAANWQSKALTSQGQGYHALALLRKKQVRS